MRIQKSREVLATQEYKEVPRDADLVRLGMKTFVRMCIERRTLGVFGNVAATRFINEW